MSKYLLKISGSNEIVNIVEWNGSGSLTAPSGYEFQAFVTESTDFINYVESASLDTTPVFSGKLFGEFEGKLTGSITIEGETIDNFINKTPYGTLTLHTSSLKNIFIQSGSFKMSGSNLYLPLYPNTNDKYNYIENYSSSFAGIISGSIKNYIFSLENECLSFDFLIKNTQVTSSISSSLNNKYFELEIEKYNIVPKKPCGFNSLEAFGAQGPSDIWKNIFDKSNKLKINDENLSELFGSNFNINFNFGNKSIVTDTLIVNGKKIENILNDKTEYGSLFLNFDNDTSTNPVITPPFISPYKTYFKMDGNWVNVPVTEIALSMWNYQPQKQAKYYFTLKDILNRKLVGTKLILTQLKTSISKVYKITGISKSGYLLEDDPDYNSESINFIPGFFILQVEDISYNIDQIPQESYVDDEYSIDFDFSNLQKLYEKTVITPNDSNYEYIIPSWARKVTVIAIGGGGGGGGGVGIYRDAHYPMQDSVDLLHYNIDKYLTNQYPYDQGHIDMPANQKVLSGVLGGDPNTYSLYNRSFIGVGQYSIPDDENIKQYFNKMTGSIKYEVVVGGGGGAGGNVVWKTYNKNSDYFDGDKFVIYPGKGGKGGKGGNGKILNRNYLDLGLYSNEDAEFLSKNSIKKEVLLYFKRYIKNPESFGTARYAQKRYSYYIRTRSGQLNWIKNNNNKKTPYVVANSGGDSFVRLINSNYLTKDTLVAEGGYGGFPGHAIFRPTDWTASLGIPQYQLQGMYDISRGANLFHWPIHDDNGQAVPWNTSNYQSHPGASHIQTINKNYDGILVGGPGGHGVAMPIQGGERFFNYAPDLPWNLSKTTFTSLTNNLAKPWGSNGNREAYHGMQYVGFDNPSDFAPTGGGGGNGAILPILKQREQFILDNPGLDTDSIETTNDPRNPFGGKGGFYFSQDMTIGLGGKNKSQTKIFDLNLGEGGNGGNSFVYPPNSLTVTQPTSGSSYGGGGGGGASLFFDLQSDPTAIGQDGADGGDGVVVIIAESN